MRLAIPLLLLLLGGCAFIGSLVHGGTVAAGAAAGGAVGGPAGAAVGGVIGFYGGELAAEQVTGTRGVRVGPDGETSSSVSSGLTDGFKQAAGIPDMELIIWIAIGAFVLFNTAYGVSLRGKLKNLDHDDEKWIKEVYEPEKAAAREQIAALREEVAALRSKTTALRRRPR